MPLYEYRCGGCATRFEVLQRLGATAEEVSCPSCRQGSPQRLLSTFAAGGARSASTDFGACDTGGCCADMSGGCCREPGFN